MGAMMDKLCPVLLILGLITETHRPIRSLDKRSAKSSPPQVLIK
jgi:hypothetical protein